MTQRPPYRDPHGAGFATFGYDGNEHGAPHIVDARTLKPLYQLPPCDLCGISTWSSTPEPKSCAHHQRGRVARNQNEATDDLSADLGRPG